ncbi:unnamed protein product [Adineta steineri]|uniref:NHL repeat containing protein n=1 Tax=Adineta steineri TaxID=433720 RepID=A0A814G7A0_9BILA|nr:unnamed protein product [Adineta steineri]
MSEKISSLIQKLKRFPKTFNLFQSIPPTTDEHDLRNEILSTRLFIFLLLLSLGNLLIYNSLGSAIKTDILEKPSFQQYKQLYSEYPKTLTCPCKTILINYTDILHINYTLHQVCTSIFVTKDWINYLTYTDESNTVYGNDFRSNGRFTFQALVVFCKLANRTVSDSLTEFLLNMYISTTVTPLELFQSQIQTFIYQFNSSIINNFLRTLDLIRSTTHTNTLYSVARNQYYFVLSSTGTILLILQDYSECTCLKSAKCVIPSSIKNSNNTPVFVVPGLYDGCYIVEALLQSTLECFYSQTCITQLQSHYNSNSTMNIRLLDISSKTKYFVNSTVQHLLNQLMIEEWNPNDKYENYYNKCQPIECSYSYETRNGIVYIITALLGLVGGLVTVLKIVVPRMVKFIRRKKQPETPRNDTNTNGRLLLLWQKTAHFIRTLNLFPSIPPSINERDLRNEILSTRLFIFLLTLCLVILLIYNALVSVIRTDFLKKPSLEEYERLYAEYPQTLTCPCKTILINYTDILHINYTLHQVCTSIFVTETWLSHVTVTDEQRNYLNHKDFRNSADSIFQALTAFCKLANRTVADSLTEFLLNMYISTTVTSLELFQSQIRTFIHQFNSSIIDNFRRTLDLVQSTTHTNTLFSALRTNYNFHVLNDTDELYLQPLNYSDCDCSVSATCVERMSIFYSETKTVLLNISGLYTGCYIVEALLQSTLEFFYSQKSIAILKIHFGILPDYNIRSLNASSKSRYSVNSTIQHLLDQLMIEEWNPNDKYKNYYNKCQPIECSYSYETRNGIVYIITALLGLVGGLVTVLKIVVPRMSVEVNSNKTRLRTFYEHFRKRKLMWLIIFIVFIDVVIVIPTIIIIQNNRKMKKGLTPEVITTTTTTVEITTSTTTAKITTSTRTSKQILPSVIINNNTKWKQNAITVAGGNGQGHELNQLNAPYGIYVDNDDQSIYIADSSNDRIVRWEFDAKNGEIVAGGNGPGDAINQLSHPQDVILDKEKKYLIICDHANQRVMRWSRQNSQDQQILIHDIVCLGLAMDNNGDLYISDVEKDAVRRFHQGDKIGTVVAGGNGQGNQLNQLANPRFIFVDESYSVYVADTINNRVVKWMKNTTEGIRVAPGQVSINNSNLLFPPNGVIIDHMGNLYVSNRDRHQIMRWSPYAIEGTPVAGKKQYGWGPTELTEPEDLSFDQQGNLYAADRSNHRIQKFVTDCD